MNTILHLGTGAFHRAHQAAYLNRLREAGERDWIIVGANLRPDLRDVEEALAAQGCEYALRIASVDGTIEEERIRSIGRILPWDPESKDIVRFGAAPSTRIITCTVTESGYEDGAPIYDALARILEARRALGSGPVTVLSCDNLRANGERLRDGLLRRRPGTPVDATFPNCMVDRITPTPSHPTTVLCERFTQWVIEDRFAAGRPAWEKAGALFVSSVAPYEEAKTRVLNASHSALAWAGALRGHRLVRECAAEPALRAMAHAYVSEEVIPRLAGSPVDLPAYLDQVLARFSNPHLPDTVQRICGGSAAKVRAFVVPNLLERLRAGEAIPRTGELGALFLRFLDARRRGALGFEHHDEELAPPQVAALFAGPDPAGAFCALPQVWGAAAGNPLLEREVRRACKRPAGLSSAG